MNENSKLHDARCDYSSMKICVHSFQARLFPYIRANFWLALWTKFPTTHLLMNRAFRYEHRIAQFTSCGTSIFPIFCISCYSTNITDLNGCLHSTSVHKTSLNEPLNSIGSAWLLTYLIACSLQKESLGQREAYELQQKSFLQ